jgi:hypothetical protein
MTVSPSQPFASYVGDDVSVAFAIPFEFYEGSDLQVRLYPDYNADPSDYQTLVLGGDFTVTGGDGLTGSLTTFFPPPANYTLTIRHLPPLGQYQSYQRHGVFPAEANETALDKLAMQIRAVAYALSSGTTSDGAPTGVRTFNGRDGAVVPLAGDYDGIYAAADHAHSWGQITEKPSTFPPETHTHAWGEITGKPTVFPPETHTHPWIDITGKPSTYNAGGTQTGAAQVRNTDGSTRGEDLVRAGSASVVGANITAGFAGYWTYDTTLGTYREIGKIGYGQAENMLAIKTAQFESFGINAETIHLWATNFTEGQVLSVGPNGQLITVPVATPSTLLTDSYSGTNINLPDGTWITAPIDVTLDKAVSAGGGEWHLLLPISANGNTDFTLEIEGLRNGTPDGNVGTIPYTLNTSLQSFVLDRPVAAGGSPGDVIGFRVRRVGGPTQVQIACAANTFKLDLVIYGSAGGGSTAYIDDLLDVDTTTNPPTEGQVLTWVSAAGQWRPAAPGAGGTAGVASFNGRTGAVLPASGDYSAFYKNISYVPTWNEITGKPTEFPPVDHTHLWDEITNKPTSFTPEAHTHFWADISDKPSTFPPSTHSHTTTDLPMATQAQAEAGTDNATLMTPLRTKEAIAALGGGGGGTVGLTLLRAPQVLRTGTSYVTPAGCTAIYVEAVGGGGGGGGAQNTGSGSGTQFGGGGGAGGLAADFLTVTPDTAYAYVIGAGGNGGSSTGGNGSNGGSTTFTVGGTVLAAAGGSRGNGRSNSSANSSGFATGGAGGGATGGSLNSAGQGGSYAGGASFFGGGIGGGGNGGSVSAINVGQQGVAGTDGCIRIWEYGA